MATIGSVTSTRREVSGVTPAQAPSDPFRAMRPTLAALEDQAPAYASIQSQLIQRENVNQNLTLAMRDREEKVLSSRLTSEFIGIKNNLSRGMLTAYDEAEPGHAGFTTRVAEESDAALQGFLAKVPERLRPQFEADVAAARESLTNQAFQLQVQSENSEFRRGVISYASDIVENINTAVITNAEDIDAIETEALAELDKLFQNNPLDRASAEVFREEILTSVKAAKLGRLALEEALDRASMGGTTQGTLQTEGTVVKSSGPVVAGISAPMAGVLNAISSKESGGEYNIMYSPDGRRYFSDFSDHPNNPATIKDGPNAGKVSTAAGKYQFIYSTWKMAQQALGLPDFSPESQDLAAAWYAKKVYNDATGRDLESVLLSGHGPSIAAAREILASGPGWEGLKSMKDADFINIIAGATGNPSSLIYDEEFSAVPMEDRVAIINDALAKSDSIRAMQQAEFTRQRTSAIDALKFGLNDGSAGQADILTAQRQWNLNFDETQTLTKLFEEKNGRALDANRAITIVTDPAAVFDPSSEEDKRAMGALFQETGMGEALANRDQQYVDSLIRPSVEKTGFIPPVLAQSLSSLMLSRDTNQADFAMQTIVGLQQLNGAEAVRVFGKEALAAASLYTTGKAYIPQDQLMRYVRNELTAPDRQVIEVREKAIAKAITDQPDDFTPVGIASNLGAEAPVDGLAGLALASEFRSLYNYFYSALGDHGAARDKANEMLATQWGETSVGGDTYLMKYPPEKAGALPFEGGYDWITRDLASDLKVPEGVGFRLVSDANTERDVVSGRPPSYSVVVQDSNGLLRGLTLGDTGLYDPREDPPEVALLPLRYVAELTPQVKVREFEAKVQAAQDTAAEQSMASPLERPEYNYFFTKMPEGPEAEALRQATTPEQQIQALQNAIPLLPPEDRMDARFFMESLGVPRAEPAINSLELPQLEFASTAPTPTYEPLRLSPTEEKVLSTVARLTNSDELTSQITVAMPPEDRRRVYNQIMEQINAMPPGPVALQLKRQMATIFWRHMK